MIIPERIYIVFFMFYLWLYYIIFKYNFSNNNKEYGFLLRFLDDVRTLYTQEETERILKINNKYHSKIRD